MADRFAGGEQLGDLRFGEAPDGEGIVLLEAGGLVDGGPDQLAEGADGVGEVAAAAAVLEEGGSDEGRERLHGGEGLACLGLDLSIGGLGDGEPARHDVVGAGDGADVARGDEGNLGAAVDVAEGRGVQGRARSRWMRRQRSSGRILSSPLA